MHTWFTEVVQEMITYRGSQEEEGDRERESKVSVSILLLPKEQG